MKIIGKDAAYVKTDEERVLYKAAFTTSDGVIHRVDFDEDGRIANLCEYTAHKPDILLDDLKQLIESIETIVRK
ncbi:MAG: hypothetical protein ABH885_02305 [Candidatus Omnitrophota bacterium]